MGAMWPMARQHPLSGMFDISANGLHFYEAGKQPFLRAKNKVLELNSTQRKSQVHRKEMFRIPLSSASSQMPAEAGESVRARARQS